MKIIKFLTFLLSIILAIYIASFGFKVPNSAAADLIFGLSFLVALPALAILLK